MTPQTAQRRSHRFLENMKLHGTALLLLILMVSCGGTPEPTTEPAAATDREPVNWVIAEFLDAPPAGLSTSGDPVLVDSPFGPAVEFDGEDDALFLDSNALAGLDTFTLEVVFRPDADGPPEQRFLHFGQPNGERVLLETRVTDDGEWYLDSFIQKGEAGQALIDPEQRHEADRWFHLAYVVDKGQLKNYVDGELELTGAIPFSGLEDGGTSIGVRLNRVHWFKGAFYTIRITPEALEPAAFTRPKE